MPGLPIARLMDQGAHGDVIIQGAITVKANKLAVHRMFDSYVCPILGMGVTINNCSTTVKAEKIPVAHLGSMGMCAMALPTVLVTGSPNVNVGP